MLLYCVVELEKLQELGKAYPWERPHHCPRCRSRRLWGHGTVLRYVNLCSVGIYLKRYQCQECQSVHTIWPSTHLGGGMYDQETIRRSLTFRLEHGHYAHHIAPRETQHYWYTNLRRQFQKQSITFTALELLEYVVKTSTLLISRCLSIRLNRYEGEPPYLNYSLSKNSSA